MANNMVHFRIINFYRHPSQARPIALAEGRSSRLPGITWLMVDGHESMLMAYPSMMLEVME